MFLESDLAFMHVLCSGTCKARIISQIQGKTDHVGIHWKGPFSPAFFLFVRNMTLHTYHISISVPHDKQVPFCTFLA